MMYNMQRQRAGKRSFGDHLREAREERQKADRTYSLRQVAERSGIEPGYLSRIERDEVPPPSEEVVRRLAETLGGDPDILLALAGRVSSELQAIILKRPKLFADLLRQLRSAPDHAILSVVREVRDGKW
jgi:transcriptional regulator with XRE-family HTH domain